MTVVGGSTGVPADAEAVVLNVTGVFPSQATHLTVWPAGVARPLASNVNLVPGDVRPNLVLVRVGAGASLAASFGVPVASLGGALENSVGIRNRSGTASLLLETSAEYRSEAVGHRSATAGVWTIEVPLVGGDNQPVVATEMLSDGSGQTLRRSVVGFDRSEVAELVDSARRHIGDGEAEAAAADLQALWSTADSGVTWRDATFGEIDSDLHELDVGAALGPKLGGSVGAGRLVVEYGD